VKNGIDSLYQAELPYYTSGKSYIALPWPKGSFRPINANDPSGKMIMINGEKMPTFQQVSASGVDIGSPFLAADADGDAAEGTAPGVAGPKRAMRRIPAPHAGWR